MSDSQKVVVIGAGKIGQLVVRLLSERYPVHVCDADEAAARRNVGDAAQSVQGLDVQDAGALRKAIEGATITINCCPHFCNLPIATAAAEVGTSYIDMSEDVETGNAIVELARDTPHYFVPRCGIAPGFIQIVAAHLMAGYESIDRAHLRVGALPENPTNALKYNLTWSTDGLINEYGNPCEAVVDGKLQRVEPLEGYERLVIDGVEYEAFNTSGGLGTLAQSMIGKAKHLNYKTIRYVGHRDLMKFLMFDLKLNEYRNILKQILESAVPATQQDRVVVLVSVVGQKGGVLTQQTYTKTVRSGERYGRKYSAIQLITASSAAAVADLVLTGQMPHTGYVRQEELDFIAFCRSPYGAMFRE